MYIFLIIVHVIACIGLIAIVLLQTGKGTGLANVFGSGGGVQSVFGAQTGDVLTRTTEILAAVFLITSISIAGLAMKKSSSVMTTSRVARRAAEMPAASPGAPAQSTQDLLKQIKDAAQGVKDAVQKSIPAAEQGKQEAQTAADAVSPVVPAATEPAAVPSATMTEAAQAPATTDTATAPAETTLPTAAPAEPVQPETKQ